MRSRHACLLQAVLAAAAFLPACASLAKAESATGLLPAPRVVRLYKGSLPVCSLVLAADDAVDAQAVSEMDALLRQHCGSTHPRGGVPLRLSQGETGGDLPGPDDSVSPASREGYRIDIRADGVELHGNAAAGLFYAVRSFAQLIRNSEPLDALPLGHIEDWPALAYRGFMMDVSHGAIPTVAEVRRQIDLLARFKANQYFFYVETDVDLEGMPLLRKDSNWTADDIRGIVAYARARHIDVVPCVELFGHLHDLFRIERYSPQAALPHGGEANPADPAVQSLLDNWLRQYAALFPSPWIHLGFDEPFELERAGSKAAGVAPGDLWLQHLQRLAATAASLGKRPLFWADIDEGAYIFNKYPKLAAGLPKAAIAAPWYYDARDDYSHLLDLFAANHVPILVASGISDWDTVTPDFNTTFINIDGMLAAGRKAGTLGLLNTMWSDSALALHRQAEAAVAYGAVAAWQQQPVERGNFFKHYAHATWTDAEAGQVAEALAALARAQTALREALGPETSFRMWDDPFHASTLARARAHRDDLHQARLSAEEALERLTAADTASDTSLAELRLGARMIDFAAMRSQYAVEIADNFDALPQRPAEDDVAYLLKRETSARNHSRAGDLLDLAGDLEGEYSAAWLRANKPYRLATAQARWRAEQEYWRSFQAAVWTVCRDFQAGATRPTLADVLGHIHR